MENLKSGLKTLSPTIGIIGVLIIIFFTNNPDPFSQKIFSEVLMGVKIAVWLILSYLLFSALLILFENFSVSSISIMLSSSMLIVGFVMELNLLMKLRSLLPVAVFFKSYFIIIVLNLTAIGILVWLSKDHFMKMLSRKNKKS